MPADKKPTKRHEEEEELSMSFQQRVTVSQDMGTIEVEQSET